MQKLVTICLAAGAALSFWVGQEIQGRDPLWWVFAFPAPLACLAVLGWYRWPKRKKEGKDS